MGISLYTHNKQFVEFQLLHFYVTASYTTIAYAYNYNFFFIMVVSDLEGRARERDRQSRMLGNFTFSLPGPGKLPVDCECSHLKTSISTFFPFSFWFPFPGYYESASRVKIRISCTPVWNKLPVNHTFKIPQVTHHYFGAEPIFLTMVLAY